MSHFVNLRDKYYSDKEVWITEFGWDTNQSYTTETSAHAYGDYTGRQVQAMWLTRAYLLLSSCGVDKATMYMCEDVGNEVTSIGKYGTCGIWTEARTANDEHYKVYDATPHDLEGKPINITFEVYEVKTNTYDEEQGKEVEITKYYRVDNDKEVTLKTSDNPTGITIQSKMEAKAAYYYMYTLKTALGEMTFTKEIDSGNDDVWVYEFSNGQGKVGYAVWCPTSNSTVVENYELVIDGSKATLIETDYKNADIDGVATNLQITNNKVTITVSENPVYVIVE
jgi:hypothetical protein